MPVANENHNQNAWFNGIACHRTFRVWVRFIIRGRRNEPRNEAHHREWSSHGQHVLNLKPSCCLFQSRGQVFFLTKPVMVLDNCHTHFSNIHNSKECRLEYGLMGEVGLFGQKHAKMFLRTKGIFLNQHSPPRQEQKWTEAYCSWTWKQIFSPNL